MTAPRSVVVGAQGVSTIDRAMMGKMTVEGNWELKSYKFDEDTVQFLMLDDSTALLAYKVTEDLEVEGSPLTLEANDSSVWRHEGGEWLCAMHTESPVGDPFARDRK